MIRLVARPTFGYRFLDSPAHAEAGGQADDLGNVVQLSFVCMVCSRNQRDWKKKLSGRTYDAEVGKEEVVYRDTPATKSSLFYFAAELY